MRIAIAERLGITDAIVEMGKSGDMQVSNAKVTQQKVKFQPPKDFISMFDLTTSNFSEVQK